MMQLESAPEQALNRIMPGLGQMLPRMNLSQQASNAGSWKIEAVSNRQATKQIDAASFEEVVFPGNLYTQIMIPGGGEDIVRLGLKPEKRPLFGRKNQLLPYTLRISAPGSDTQTVGGQVELRPRIRHQSRHFPHSLFPAFSLLWQLLNLFIGGKLHPRRHPQYTSRH